MERGQRGHYTAESAMPPGAGNGTGAHLSFKGIVESEARIRESGRDDVVRDEEEEDCMPRRPTSPPAHVSLAQSKPCKRRPAEKWAAALQLWHWGRDGRGCSRHLHAGAKRADHTRRSEGTASPPSTFVCGGPGAWGTLLTSRIWCLCLSMHGVWRTEPPFARI
jgi:hypothetical protein